MGWTGTHREHGKSLRQFFEEEFNWAKGEVVDLATVNRNTCYILWRVKAHTNFGIYVPERLTAMVVLVSFPSKSYYNIMYKEMGETSGPYRYDCPARILDRLDPPENMWAWEWRQKCRETIKKRQSKPKLKVGDTLVFNREIPFRDGHSRKEFKVYKTKPLRFVDEYGTILRLTRDLLLNVKYEHKPAKAA